MHNFSPIERILKSLGDTVRLSPDERSHMERVLSEYMALKPVRVERMPRRGVVSHMALVLFVMRRRLVPAALIAALFVGGGVSYAAEGALPGDFLYPVKVSFNEEVRGSFAVTPEARAVWNTKRVERRLKEAVELASSGALTPEAGADLALRLETQAVAASHALDALEERHSDDVLAVTADFDAALSSHGNLLDALADAGEGIRRQARVIANIARAQVRTLAIADPTVSSRNTLKIAEDSSMAVVTELSLSSTSQDDEPETTATRASVRATPTITLEALHRLATSANKTLRATATLLSRAEEGRRGSLSLNAEARTRMNAELTELRRSYEVAVELTAAGNFEAAYRLLLEVVAGSQRLMLTIETGLSAPREPVFPSNGTDDSSHTDIQKILPPPIQSGEGKVEPPVPVRLPLDLI